MRTAGKHDTRGGGAIGLQSNINTNDSHLWIVKPGLARYASPMVKILVRWLLLAAALLFVAYVLPGVTVQSFGSAMIAALVLGLLNTLLRPVLVILTLPVTLLTLGLFLFIINALMFYFAAQLLDGLAVNGGSGNHGKHVRISARELADWVSRHLA